MCKMSIGPSFCGFALLHILGTDDFVFKLYFVKEKKKKKPLTQSPDSTTYILKANEKKSVLKKRKGLWRQGV
jgi:hypothetical protein